MQLIADESRSLLALLHIPSYLELLVTPVHLVETWLFPIDISGYDYGM